MLAVATNLKGVLYDSWQVWHQVIDELSKIAANI